MAGRPRGHEGTLRLPRSNCRKRTCEIEAMAHNPVDCGVLETSPPHSVLHELTPLGWVSRGGTPDTGLEVDHRGASRIQL